MGRKKSEADPNVELTELNLSEIREKFQRKNKSLSKSLASNLSDLSDNNIETNESRGKQKAGSMV